MTIRHMKIFLEVFRAESVTQAAQRLHLTQPAVTRAIQELEGYYGVCLFERINRRLRVTEAGRQLYTRALHIVDTFDEMEQGLRNWDALGILRVGSSVTLGNFAMPELVAHFQADHPQMKLRVTIRNGIDLQNLLLENQLDLALIESHASGPDLVCQPFCGDRLVLVTPPGHPLLGQAHLVLEDVLPYDLLLRERGSAGRSFLDHIFAVRGVTLQPLWESVSTQALVKAAAKGFGISLLPELLVRGDLRGGEVCTRAFEDTELTRRNYIVWHKNKRITKAIRDFIDLCEAYTYPTA